MNPSRQRQITFALLLALAVAFGVRRYITSREELRLVEEFIPFSITNDVVTFRYWRGDFARTNAQLAAMLRQSQGTTAVVTMRERWRSAKIVGWRAIEFAVPTTSE